MLKETVKINKSLIEEGLVIFTWGNASIRDKKTNQMFIKPSGVPFDELSEEKISVVNLKTGEKIRGLNPSVDSNTHIELYNAFPDAQSIIHTHSKYCTVFAQAGLPIPCLGTTHADYFFGDVPVIGDLLREEIEVEYEKNTGLKIVEYFNKNKISPLEMKAVLCPSHGVFVWGNSPEETLKNAIVLETIAEMAYKTQVLCYIGQKEGQFDKNLLNKHFLRKHGNKKYYGQ